MSDRIRVAFEYALRFQQPRLVLGFGIELDSHDFRIFTATEENVAFWMIGNRSAAVQSIRIVSFSLAEIHLSDFELLSFEGSDVQDSIVSGRDDVLLIIGELARKHHRLRLFVPKQRHSAFSHVVDTDSFVTAAGGDQRGVSVPGSVVCLQKSASKLP